MAMMFDFTCSDPTCGKTHEKLTDSETRERECPHCGAVAKRIISPVRCKLDPISGDFPGATLAWEKSHEQGGKLR